MLVCLVLSVIPMVKNGFLIAKMDERIFLFSLFFSIHCIRVNGTIQTNFADAHEKSKSIAAIREYWPAFAPTRKDIFYENYSSYFWYSSFGNIQIIEKLKSRQRFSSAEAPLYVQISKDLQCEYINLLYPGYSSTCDFRNPTDGCVCRRHALSLSLSLTITLMETYCEQYIRFANANCVLSFEYAVAFFFLAHPFSTRNAGNFVTSLVLMLL